MIADADVRIALLVISLILLALGVWALLIQFGVLPSLADLRWRRDERRRKLDRQRRLDAQER